MSVAGVDGCRVGWVVAHLEGAPGPIQVRLEVANSFGDVLRCTGECTAVGVDIPIGLPARDGRACDTAARTLLRGRASSVFPAPVRSVLKARSHEQAIEISERCSGKGISAQTYGLLAKIREVDDCMSPALQGRVFEVHPEVSFQQALNAGRTLDFGKKSAIGVLARLGLLRNVGLDPAPALAAWGESGRAGVEGKVGLDDVLDAVAAAWTALRHVRGLTQVVTQTKERDRKELCMQITW